MSSPDKIKAIVLTCDRFRAITRHLILKYERLWPDHPFVFHVPYQELRGTDTDRVKYHAAPEDVTEVLPDPYESVCLADPSWVELVCIGGDVTYGRADWFAALSGASLPRAPGT